MFSRSEREVAGYVKALKYIYNHFKDLEFTEQTIRSLHQLLTSELLNKQLHQSQRGAYKNVPKDVVERNQETGETKVWFRTTPPGPQTSAAMKQLIESYHQVLSEESAHPLVATGSFVVVFLAIHPFRDGN